MSDDSSSLLEEERSLFRPFTRESLLGIEARIADELERQKELEKRRAEGEVRTRRAQTLDTPTRTRLDDSILISSRWNHPDKTFQLNSFPLSTENSIFIITRKIPTKSFIIHRITTNPTEIMRINNKFKLMKSITVTCPSRDQARLMTFSSSMGKWKARRPSPPAHVDLNLA